MAGDNTDGLVQAPRTTENGAARFLGAISSFARKHALLFWFLLVFLLWSPWLIACAPGSNSTDTLAQLSQFLGHRAYSNHHPVFVSFVFGAVYYLGMFVDGNQGGHMALFTFQVVLMAFIVALAARWMTRAEIRLGVVSCITLFIALCPVFPMFAQWLVKNTLAAGVMYLFAVQLVILILKYERGGVTFSVAVMLVAACDNGPALLPCPQRWRFHRAADALCGRHPVPQESPVSK